jgi:hypothetical protein
LIALIRASGSRGQKKRLREKALAGPKQKRRQGVGGSLLLALLHVAQCQLDGNDEQYESVEVDFHGITSLTDGFSSS